MEPLTIQKRQSRVPYGTRQSRIPYGTRQSWLSWFFRGLLIFALIILIGRLIELQVIKGDYYKILADENRVRRVSITAPRGKILARGGEVLVGNEEVKRSVIFSSEEGFTKSDDIENIPDEEIITEYIRNYSLSDKLAHVSGYLGEVNDREVGEINPDCPQKGPYKLGQLIGRSGLEQQYECELGGIDGEELVEVDTTGQRIRTLGRREPIAGNDIRTFIDINLQSEVAKIVGESEDIPKERRVAVIVTDTGGQVLSLFSSPSYDPNAFVDSKRASEVRGYLESDDLPMFNRVIGGLYHPGSVYKPVVSIAALEEGVIDEDFTFNDTGSIELKTLYGDFAYKNWYFTQYGRTEGEIGLIKAISRSTDTFFYKTGELLGIEKLVEWSERFELDQLTELDIPGEVEGLVPSPEWKEFTKGERWFLGNTYHLSIGQGDLALTPIGLNRAISVVASDGKLCKNKIAEDPNCKDLNISDKSLDLVKQGMFDACAPDGTAFTFFEINGSEDEDVVKVACKTGTAETGEFETSHAWFSVFAPANLPEIVITVMVEEGGSGSYVASPIAREIYNYWFGVEP